MPPFGPVSQKDLVGNFRRLGFTGPISGGKHPYMVKGERRVWLPNPHTGNISKGFLARILRQAGISKTEWEKL